MNVGYLITPCIPSLLQMWVHKFGFTPVSSQEMAALEEQIILMDPSATHLLKKSILQYAVLGIAQLLRAP